MKTCDEIRRENLAILINEAGDALALAEAYGCSEPYIKQMREGYRDSKTGRPRTVGTDTARRLEVAMSKPRGWMDNDHEAADYPAEANVTRLMAAESEAQAYLHQLGELAERMAPEGRAVLLYEARKIAEAFPAAKANPAAS